MVRLISWLVTFALALGIGEAVVKEVYRMATAARDAQQNDSISYAKFTRAMTGPATTNHPKSPKHQHR